MSLFLYILKNVDNGDWQPNPIFLGNFFLLGFTLQKWAATWQNQQNECAPREDSDQPGHPPSLISLRCPHEESLGLSYPLSAQRRLWSDWMDAQADPSLRWAQSLCWFCHVTAQIQTTVADPERVCLDHPLNQNYFILIGNFRKICLSKLISKLISKFEPPI